MRVLTLTVFAALGQILISTASGETVNCTFSADQIVSLSESEVEQSPFRNCWVYIFSKDETDTLQMVPSAPARTNEEGECDFEFDECTLYKLYFSGKPLTADEVSYVLQHGSKLLIPFRASTEEDNSDFNVYQHDGNLKVNLQHSLPLWITHLHRVEEHLNQTSRNAITSAQVTSKVRKLFEDGGYWRFAAPGSTSPMIDFNSITGEIEVQEVPVELCERVSRAYSRSGSQFVLRDGERIIVKRFDLVTLKGGVVVRIDRILFGLDSTLTPPSPTIQVRLKDHVAAVTWARDLGMAAFDSIMDTNRPPSNEQWQSSLAKHSEANKLVADLHTATSIAAIQLTNPNQSLSQLVETQFGSISFDTIRTRLRAQYGITEADTEANINAIADYISRAANAWTRQEWSLFHSVSRSASLRRASTHFLRVLTESH